MSDPHPSGPAMQFASAWTSSHDRDVACDRLAASLHAEIGSEPDLMLVFMTQQHLLDGERILARLRSALRPRVLLAASAESVIGDMREIERSAGISALAAHLPGVTIETLDEHDLDHPTPEAMADRLAGPDGGRPRGLVMLADPFSVPIINRLHRLGDALPELPVVGGLASAGRGPGTNLIACNERLRSDGLAGVALHGNIAMDTLVSQGCKPIGPDLVVTQCQRNLVFALAGRPALDVLREILESLEEPDRALVRAGLYIGRVVDERKRRFGRGDYLVRAVVGADPSRGFLALDEPIRPGQTIRFHLRDAETARSDLELLLNIQQLHGPPAGVVLMSGAGRGERLFGRPDHDARTVARAFEGMLPGEESARAGEAIVAHGRAVIPLAGMHAAGEIGPIGGRPFLHGHSACLGLFRPLDAASAT